MRIRPQRMFPQIIITIHAQLVAFFDLDGVGTGGVADDCFPFLLLGLALDGAVAAVDGRGGADFFVV
jgi:hypothetical protein